MLSYIWFPIRMPFCELEQFEFEVAMQKGQWLYLCLAIVRKLFLFFSAEDAAARALRINICHLFFCTNYPGVTLLWHCSSYQFINLIATKMILFLFCTPVAKAWRYTCRWRKNSFRSRHASWGNVCQILWSSLINLFSSLLFFCLLSLLPYLWRLEHFIKGSSEVSLTLYQTKHIFYVYIILRPLSKNYKNSCSERSWEEDCGYLSKICSGSRRVVIRRCPVVLSVADGKAWDPI